MPFFNSRPAFIVLVAALYLACSATASAHVRITPATARRGASVLLSFRVPNERSNAATVGLAVQFPQDHPIASVSVQPVAGWTAHVKMNGGVVDTIAWSGGKIGPGHAQQFPVYVDHLPASGDVLYFKAVQTYSSGEAVRWIQIRNPGEPEPPNPAPMLRLNK